MSTFSAVQYTENSSDLTKLEIVKISKPTAIKPNFVGIKIHSASINPVDLLVYQGFLKGPWSMPLPFIPGYDFSGEVTEVGSEVTGFAIGDAVFAVNWGQGKHNSDDDELPVGGAFAEYISVPASILSHKPTEVSHHTAAAVALVGTTALDALNTANVSAGTRILILGASTSVGAIATQIAKLRGAWVAATASSRSIEYARQFGADQLINYSETQWWDSAATGQSGFDVIFDTAGEDGGFEHAQTPGLVKTGGVFISIANPATGYVPSAHEPAFSHAAFLCLKNSPATQDTLASLIAEGKLRVIVDEVFPFTNEGVQAILAKTKGGKSLGKNILQIV